MSTFLELCQQAAEESGTFPTIGTPEAVTGQTGRSLRLINWVKRAAADIDRMRSDWRWLTTEFSNSTVVDKQAYTASDLGISTRFRRWVHQDESGMDTFSLYLPADGQATERFLEFKDYPEFRRLYMVGSAAAQPSNKPTFVSVDDANRLVFFNIPDAIYTVRGRYYKGPQTLTEAADTPEMPEAFHEVIVWRALIRLATFDEAFELKPHYQQFYKKLMSDLIEDQTPDIIAADPLF